MERCGGWNQDELTDLDFEGFQAKEVVSCLTSCEQFPYYLVYNYPDVQMTCTHFMLGSWHR